MNAFYHISGFEYPVELSDYWRDCILPNYFCDECGKAFDPMCPIDIHIDRSITSLPITGFGDAAIGIVSKEFIQMVGDSLFSQYFNCGKVFGPSEQVLSNYVTFVTKTKMLTIRGGKESTFEKCLKCQRYNYFPLPVGKRYLLRASVDKEKVYQSQFAQLIVSEDIKLIIKFKKWPKMFVEKLPVLEAPLDGLPLNIVA